MDSILDSIKQLLGISTEDTNFDLDIIIHINSVFSNLNQLGVGPSKTFSIFNNASVWDDFIEDDSDFNNVITYMYLKVKLLFDPPANSTVLNAIKEEIKELEFRLGVSVLAKSMEEDNE